jgi:hypothetical protein
MITDYKLVNTEHKTGGNFTFFRNILLFGDDKEYQVIEDITREGNKTFFVNYTVTSNYQSSYLPEINYNRNKNCFTVCCYSHGNMTPDEFEKFIEDQQKGLELAKFLTQVFCINPTEEEEDDYETR